MRMFIKGFFIRSFTKKMYTITNIFKCNLVNLDKLVKFFLHIPCRIYIYIHRTDCCKTIQSLRYGVCIKLKRNLHDYFEMIDSRKSKKKYFLTKEDQSKLVGTSVLSYCN